MRDIPAENLPKEIRQDAPFISDGFMSEIDALEESADRAEGKRAGTVRNAKGRPAKDGK
jgi:hypothetical protein